MNRQNKCERLIEVGIMCGDKPWQLADRKTVSRLYLSIGVEGRCILNCKNPDKMIDTLPTVDFWKIVDEAFIRPRNITFDRHVFLITKQLRGETVEQFYGKLKELAENCDFENKEETLIRDVFITNLIDPEIQEELLKQTAEPHQALELAINMELGMRNQHQIQQYNKIVVPANVNAVQFSSNTRTPNWQNSNNISRENNRSTLYCSNCGGIWLRNHRDKCIAKGKTCNIWCSLYFIRCLKFSSFHLSFIHCSYLVIQYLVICLSFPSLGFPLRDHTCLITHSRFAFKLFIHSLNFAIQIQLNNLLPNSRSASKRKRLKSGSCSRNRISNKVKRTRTAKQLLYLSRVRHGAACS